MSNCNATRDQNAQVSALDPRSRAAKNEELFRAFDGLPEITQAKALELAGLVRANRRVVQEIDALDEDLLDLWIIIDGRPEDVERELNAPRSALACIKSAQARLCRIFDEIGEPAAEPKDGQKA